MGNTLLSKVARSSTFRVAVALAFGVETAKLTYLLVEFGEENGGELQIPDDVKFFDLIAAANEVDVPRGDGGHKVCKAMAT